jgi:hypothetical protein
MSADIPCTAAERPCAAPAECRHAGICLGSDDSAYPRWKARMMARMKMFSEWVAPQFVERER